jgi:lantibiotic biosynthesis protein
MPGSGAEPATSSAPVALKPGAFRLLWATPLPAELAGRAVTVAAEAAQRLRDRRGVERASAAAARQTAFPQSVRWQPVSLAYGDAGLAVACAYLDACFPDEGWDRIGYGYLIVAAEDAERYARLPAGLWGGMAGLGLAAWSLSRNATRYQRLLASVDEALLPQVARQADRLAGLEDGMSPGEFDVISGFAGVGGYLLGRRESGAAGAALDIVLRALVELTAAADALPRWWTPPELMGNEVMAAQHPHGNLNCGLAHGIPGPLAAMSLAQACGVTVPGLPEAVDRAAGWLAGHRADDDWGVNWPVAVPLAAEGSVEAVEPGCAGKPSRSAWCYGAPGVARALWLAGLALDRAGWRDLAVEAMRAVYRRPAADRFIDSPTFCHGVAGLLQVTLRFAHDTGLRVFADAAADLAGQLLGLYEPGSLLGYRDIERHGGPVDDPGLLNGAPGVMLTLLAAATDVEPRWDRAFLLA